MLYFQNIRYNFSHHYADDTQPLLVIEPVKLIIQNAERTEHLNIFSDNIDHSKPF